MHRIRDANFLISIGNQIIMCPDFGTSINFQPVLDHFAQIYVLYQKDFSSQNWLASLTKKKVKLQSPGVACNSDHSVSESTPNQIGWETQKWHWFSLRQMVLELLIKTCKILFWTKTRWSTKIFVPFLNFSHNLLQDAYVACRSETCAILKQVSDWHGVPFWKMCISETCFRLALCKLCHIEVAW